MQRSIYEDSATATPEELNKFHHERSVLSFPQAVIVHHVWIGKHIYFSSIGLEHAEQDAFTRLDQGRHVGGIDQLWQGHHRVRGKHA